MEKRTFGWIQNPSSIDTLRNVLGIFVTSSEFHKELVNTRLPLLANLNLFASPNLFLGFQKVLRSSKPISYDVLKGKGKGSERSRTTAKCSGIVQAAITGQQNKEYVINGKVEKIKKPYTDDWTADGFLRWAVSLGFLDYNYQNDTCSITDSGKAFVLAENEEEKNIVLGKAFLSYPPVCRVLGLLKKYGHMTKFEIGAKLGFTDEPGFTSFPQNIWVQAFEESIDPEEKRKLRSDTEGSSDKYARMICRWLVSIGWVERKTKVVTEKMGLKVYNCAITSAYEITSLGLQMYNEAVGLEGNKRIPKIVYREMLASKAHNVEYLRTRRALMLMLLGDHKAKTVDDVQAFLMTKGIEESSITLKDDLQGLMNIGLDITSVNDSYTLHDNILKLSIFSDVVAKETADAVVVKERVRAKLHNINHKFLTLIDYAFSGRDKCAEFEIYTIDLLVNELKFNGVHLGGTRKPDGLFYYEHDGVIVDNKAYSKGFTISRHMADEMVRYVQENSDRNIERNPLQWWTNFGDAVNHFNYVFISSLFKGDIEGQLNNIRQSTGVDGCVLTAENLLYYAEAIKGGYMNRKDFISKFGINKELVFAFNS